LLLGIGYQEEKLKKLAEKLGIQDRVSFEGFQKDVNSYLSHSDCFVFSSDYEGFGNVIIEALNAGLPVISTDCPSGPREILSPGSDPGKYITNSIEFAPYGILTPVGKEEYLAEAMIKIMNDGLLRQQYKERAVLRSRDFDLQQTVKKYFDLF
jgi:N-acetylgalactosamine-N,N'-diacetylbacillosaminyl-diphospho-undecaprenol 4-alpha-N-acetylgalactosaminyltransferase